MSIAKAPVAKAIHTKNILNYSIALSKGSFLTDLNVDSKSNESINPSSSNSGFSARYVVVTLSSPQKIGQGDGLKDRM
jgi:hypothetical protein